MWKLPGLKLFCYMTYNDVECGYITNFRIQTQFCKISSSLSLKSLNGVFLGHPILHLDSKLESNIVDHFLDQLPFVWNIKRIDFLGFDVYNIKTFSFLQIICTLFVCLFVCLSVFQTSILRKKLLDHFSEIYYGHFNLIIIYKFLYYLRGLLLYINSFFLM